MYQFVVFQPLWVIAEYQINREYIASNLCENRLDEIPTCYGSCYLNKQLQKTSEEAPSDSSPSAKRILEEDHVAYQSFLVENAIICLAKRAFIPLQDLRFISQVTFIDTPPPELV